MANAAHFLDGSAAELLTFAHRLASKEFSIVGLEVDCLPYLPVFVEGVEVFQIVFGLGETLASHHRLHCHHDKVLIADAALCALHLALCVLQRLKM